MSLLDQWIVHCADPAGTKSPPRRPLPARQAGDLVDRAEAHGVLGTVLKNFEPFRADPAFAPAHDDARLRHRANAAFALLLTREADALAESLKGVTAAIVKGPIFARHLYPSPSLRTFGDLDILTSEESVAQVAAILSDRDFRLAEHHPREQKWVHRQNGSMTVEVQTDLIHPDTLNRTISLPFRLIGDAPERPASLLLIAIVHGGAHQFDRLQHVVDICQAARLVTSADEQQAFMTMLDGAHAQYLAVAGLVLAARLFNEPHCRALAAAIPRARFRLPAMALLDRTTVMSAADVRYGLYNWRRQAFRILLRYSS